MKFLKKFFKFIFYFLLPVCLCVVFLISYLALRTLVLPNDRITEDGRKMSEVASQINKEFLKNKAHRFVNFNTKDGLKLSGCLFKKTDARANLLLCHGYGSRKEFMYDLVEMFPDYNILAFDFRAHGNSQGRLRTIGFQEYQDVIAAAEFFKTQTQDPKNPFKKLPFVILGVSMGGAASLKAVEIESSLCDLLILDSAFSNLKRVVQNAFCIKSGLPAFPFLPILKTFVKYVADCDVYSMNLLEKIKDLKQPIFYMHSCIDDIVPPDETLLMYANNVNKNSKLWMGPACKHGYLRRSFWDVYKNKTLKFIKKNIYI